MTIRVSQLSKSFGTFGVLSNINLEVKTGELLALLGPSGSGKTTLLRVIAGLEQADSGEVIIDGVRANDMGIKERRVGFVFQHYALFKHMNVYDNVAFGLRVRPRDQRPGEEEIRERVMALLKLVHLDRFATRYPSQLSGGQRQRVALARSLAVEPKLLLLDEPFGALDSKVRKELRRWLRRLHEEIQITSIFVTHDQEEAMEVSDRVVVMNHGKIEQIGTPEEVYHQPRSGFVYDFLGNYNEFAGWRDEQGNIHLAEDDLWEPPPQTLQDEHPLQKTAPQFLNRYPGIGGLIRKVIPKALDARWVPAARQPSKTALRSALAKRGVPVRVFARPHEMFVALKADADGDYIPATVMHVNPAGALSKLEMERADGTVLQAELPKHVLDELAIKKGTAVFVKPKNVRVFE